MFTEKQIYQRQRAFIKKTFGEKAVESANYGWYVDDVAVTTKVYGYGVIETAFEDGRTLVIS